MKHHVTVMAVVTTILLGCSPCTTRVSAIGSYGYIVYDGKYCNEVEMYSSRVVDGVSDVTWSSVVYDKYMGSEYILKTQNCDVVDMWKKQRKGNNEFNDMIIRRKLYGDVAQIGQVVAFPIDVGISAVAITGFYVIGLPIILIVQAKS